MKREDDGWLPGQEERYNKEYRESIELMENGLDTDYLTDLTHTEAVELLAEISVALYGDYEKEASAVLTIDERNSYRVFRVRDLLKPHMVRYATRIAGNAMQFYLAEAC